MRHPDLRTRRIAGFVLISPDASRLADFYVAALGARRVSSDRLSAAQVGRSFGVHGAALRQVVALGEQTVDIVQFDIAGDAYPDAVSPYSPLFQHFAIVVSDMQLGLARLRGSPGWRAISTAGAQRLPRGSGGVFAFKFRDPDGHPLELLEFPRDVMPAHWHERSPHEIFLGIDHSAISVHDTAASIAFYERLGFNVAAQTVNQGREQSDLDGVPDPIVTVTALTAQDSTPHLELLCYRSAIRSAFPAMAGNAVAATRLRLSVEALEGHPQAVADHLTDPDGHHLILAAP